MIERLVFIVSSPLLVVSAKLRKEEICDARKSGVVISQLRFLLEGHVGLAIDDDSPIQHNVSLSIITSYVIAGTPCSDVAQRIALTIARASVSAACHPIWLTK